MLLGRRSEGRNEDGIPVVAGDSDDETAPPNGFDNHVLNLNEVCEEAGYESDESLAEGAW